MPAMPNHTKQVCTTTTGQCMCDPEYQTNCTRLVVIRAINAYNTTKRDP